MIKLNVKAISWIWFSEANKSTSHRRNTCEVEAYSDFPSRQLEPLEPVGLFKTYTGKFDIPEAVALLGVVAYMHRAAQMQSLQSRRLHLVDIEFVSNICLEMDLANSEVE